MLRKKQWPRLEFNEWKETLYTVQLWTQIVGKIRLRNLPWLNHSWHVTLYVSPAGLTTGSIPYSNGLFQIDFDFVNHQLIIQSGKEENIIIKLYARTVASFYKEVMQSLEAAGIETTIHAKPNEVDPAIPFEKDEVHCSYNPDQVNNFWRVLVNIHNVFTTFRAGFTGKCSPVHFFWGSFDLAVTRFSGKPAPAHPGGAPNVPVRVMQEAYSHELSSCGFWPGNEQVSEAIFYAYCYPSNADFSKQEIMPGEGYFNEQLAEFVLPYEAVRRSADPEKKLLQFLQSTYEAAANTAGWDRQSLECDLSWYQSPITPYKN
ncbi:DUF5996 family protein [Segetibacter sp.]|uniref:DUF5996 family protein n=1 Tax=Segetibacter sp. TaxID=2231182 RepID=UPI0026094A98|nr:DUF5996 family protein [Segetibacter sp.]MCW3081980.1 hypothetical protein [Segetibacter sp.]